MPPISLSSKSSILLFIIFSLTGCQNTLYYNAKYLDLESAQANFQNDQMRCRAFSQGQIPMPASHQVQHYDYQISGQSHTTPTLGGYQTNYQAQVTPVPSLADTALSATSTIMQSIALVTRENLYKDCLKQLGWTTNQKEAFPNNDLILDPPTVTSDSLSGNFYIPITRNNKIDLSIAVGYLNLNNLVFSNGGNSFSLNVSNFNTALREEISEHFTHLATNDLEITQADITAYPATKFVIDPLNQTYHGFLYVEFRNRIGGVVKGVRYDAQGTMDTQTMALDVRSKMLTERALIELVRSIGWLMNQRDFRQSFERIAPEPKTIQ